MSPETEAVSFPTWKSALANTGWPEAQQTEYRREILAFLHLCKVRRAPATIMLVKEYLAERARQGPNAARVPLLWFFQEAKRVAKGEVAGVKPAPPGAAGGAPRGAPPAGDVIAIADSISVFAAYSAELAAIESDAQAKGAQATAAIAEIRSVLATGAGLAQLQERLKCGTECGSCVPELKRLCAQEQDSELRIEDTAAAVSSRRGDSVSSINESALAPN